MGTYKANRNNNATEELEERPKTQEEINNENNANTINNAAEVAIASKNPYAMAAGYAVKGIDQLTGGKASQELGKAMTQINKMSPGGKQVQNLSNKLSESGVGDKIGQAASMKNGQSGGGASKAGDAASKASNGLSKSSNGLSKLGSSSSNSSTASSGSGGLSLSSNIMPSIKGKFLLLVAPVILLFLLLTVTSVVASKDNANLDLTNQSHMTGGQSGITYEGEYLGDFSTCALSLENGIYYKTTFPQTEDCLVSGWYDITNGGNSWGLEPTFYANVMALIEDAASHGCEASIISGHRTREKQQYLYNCYLTGSCNNGNLAAAPGRGNHEYGIAADLSYSPDNSMCVSYYHQNAARFGLAYTVSSEDWHIEPINILTAA